MKLYEPFAGLGAYSLYCLWQAAGSDPRLRAEPPISRVGNKAGFVRNTFRAFGLVRQTWSEVHLNDLDPVCHLFHLLYASSELRDQVARRLWAFVPCPSCMPSDVHYALEGKLKPTPATCKGKDGCPTCSGTGVQDARQLWERIRKEPVPGDVVEACAAGLYMQAREFHGKPVLMDGDGWHTLFGFNGERAPNGFQPESRVPDEDGNTRTSSPRDVLAIKVSSLPSGLASLADVTARALFLQSRSFQLKPVSIAGGAWEEKGMKPEHYEQKPGARGNPQGDDSPRWTVAERVESLPGRWVDTGFNPEDRRCATKYGCDQPRWAVADRIPLLPGPGACQIGITRMDALEFARGVKWGADCVCVVDSPYLGDITGKPTTGYAHTTTRADVLEICEMAHRGGALVICHESIGLAKELGKGWHERSASPLRASRSTFHAGGIEREWITTNRAPVWWPAAQATMFG